MQSPIPEDVRRSFDHAIIVINELTAEAVSLKEKFGERSKLYKAKVAQVENLSKFYKLTTEYLERVIKINSKLGIKWMGAELLLTQEQYKVNFRQAAKILGYNFSEEFLKAHDEIDELIAQVTKPIKFDDDKK